MTRHNATPMQDRQNSMGKALRQFREDGNLLAKDIAKAAGWKPSYLSELENGIRRLSEGAIVKLAAAFEMDPSELTKELERRAELIRTAVYPMTKETRGASSRLHEAPSSGRVAMIATQPDNDVLTLLRHLVSQLSRDQQFELLSQFMKEAQAGDTEAFKKARALFDLIQPEVVSVPP